jgi:hypothetical protein
MFFLFGLLLGAALFFLLPSAQVQNAKSAMFGDFTFPRADFGAVVSMIWGRFRQDSPVVLWYGGYRTEPITQKQKTGLFSSKNVTIGHRYFFTMDLLLGLGPDVRLKRIWANSNKLVWEGTLSGSGEIDIDLPELFGGDKKQGGLAGKIRFYAGSDDEAQDPALLNLIGPNVPKYNGMCRAVFDDFYIGATSQLPTFSFEVERIPEVIPDTSVDATMPNGKDMNPIAAALELMTTNWGGNATPLSLFDLEAFQRDAAIVKNDANNGMDQGYSQVLQQSAKAEDVLKEILEHVDGIMYEEPESGKIATRLLRQDYDINSIQSFDDSSIIGISDLKKTLWSTTVNRARLLFRNRESAYDEDMAMAEDFALIQYQKKLTSSQRTMKSVTTAVGATFIAARDLSYSNVPLISFKLQVNRTGSKVRPGDVIRMTYSKGFNMTDLVMRVSKVNLGTLLNGVVELEVVQDRFSAHIGNFAPPEASGFVPPDTTASAINSFIFKTAPFFLANQGEDRSAFETSGKFMLSTRKPSGASQSFDLAYSSVNGSVNSASELIGDDLPYSTIGTLVNDYLGATAADTRSDTTGSLTVGGLTSAELASIPDFDNLSEARDGGAIMSINDELFVFLKPIVNIGAGTVTFETLYRGVLDTQPQTHPVGSAVSFISGASSITAGLPVNAQAYMKLLDNAITGTYPIDTASQTIATPSDRAARPLPPGNVLVNGSRNPGNLTAETSVSVSWARRSRLDTQVKVYSDADGSLEAGTRVRVQWRVNGGTFNEILETGNSTSFDITDLVGTLDIVVSGYNTSTDRESLVSEEFTITLGA